MKCKISVLKHTILNQYEGDELKRKNSFEFELKCYLALINAYVFAFEYFWQLFLFQLNEGEFFIVHILKFMAFVEEWSLE